jgi:hypothetical protein
MLERGVGARGKLNPLPLKTTPVDGGGGASGGRLALAGFLLIELGRRACLRWSAGQSFGGSISFERLGIKELARRYGIDRDTVRRALRSPEPPRYQRPAVAAKLDPFKDEIHRPLGEEPG